MAFNSGNTIERALIVASPWAGLIVDGIKPWELRSRPTNIRGRIGIIEAKTGLIIGEVSLVNCPGRLKLSYLLKHKDKHHIDELELLEKWSTPWVFEQAIRYQKPVPYKHPRGAVIWVNLLLPLETSRLFRAS